MLRHTLEGGAGQVRRITVTFNQPMVEVASLERVADQFPVTLSPQPPGRWTWLDARTLAFDPAATRLPMATAYRLQVPAGVHSALGSTLASPVHWNFATGAPRLVQGSPDGQRERLYPVMLARFDQKIDPQKVLAGIRIQVAGQELPVRPAFWFDLWWASPNRAYSLEAEPDTSIAFVPLWPLTRDTPVRVVVPAGTPSQEGPRTTATPQGFSFRTHAPLRLVDNDIMRRARTRTSPASSLFLLFTNPLTDTDSSRATVRIFPPVSDLKVIVKGTGLSLAGSLRPLTAYTVTVGRGLIDSFGQALEREVSVGFHTVGATLPPAVGCRQGPLVLIKPQATPEIVVQTVNVTKVKVTLYRATSADWGDFCRATRTRDPIWNTPCFTFPFRSRIQGVRGAAPAGGANSLQVGRRRLQVREVAVRNAVDHTVETRIPLGSALRDGTGQLAVMVEPARWTGQGPRPRAIAWCEATRIRVDTFVDKSQMIVWATSLRDGSPLGGVQLTLTSRGGSIRGTTGPDGVAHLPLSAGTPSADYHGLMAQRGRDLLFVPNHGYFLFGNGSGIGGRTPQALWHVISDRGVYRPGEVIHVKGWARRVTPSATAELAPLDPRVRCLTYWLHDSESTTVLKGKVRVGPLGSFHLALAVPARMRLGEATLEISSEGTAGPVSPIRTYHAMKVEEYRAPEFEVNAAATRPGPFFADDPADVSVRASYLAGGPLPGAQVKWEVSARPVPFAPPGWEAFQFSHPSDDEEPHRVSGPWTLAGRTNTAGRHCVRISCDAGASSTSLAFEAEATVTDANRKTWTSSETLVMHPSSLFTGLASARPFVERGERIELECVTTDAEGHAVAGRSVALKTWRVETRIEKGEAASVEVPLPDATLTSGSGMVRHVVAATEPGEYHFVASVRDDRGRFHRSHQSVRVCGDDRLAGAILPSARVDLVADKTEYAPGDVARVLVHSPFAPAEGLVTIRRAGIMATQRFHLKTQSRIVEIPVTEKFGGGAIVRVDVVGLAVQGVDPAERGTPSPPRKKGVTTRKTRRSPVRISGSLPLSVSTRAHRLTVKAKASSEVVEPGGNVALQVQLADGAGHPVKGGDVTVAVVDEAALALTGYTLEDPLTSFYPMVTPHDNSVASFSAFNTGGAEFPSYNNVIGSFCSLGGGPGGIPVGGHVNGIGSTSGSRPIVRNLRGVTPGGNPFTGMTGMTGRTFAARPRSRPGAPPLPARTRTAASSARVRLRSNFKSLAVFVASVRTDANGRGTVRFRMPDNLTRYRIMAVAAAGVGSFGMAESSITARLPLMVRPSAPRFLNTGDRFAFPILLQNQTERAMDVEVAVRAANVRFLAPEAAGTGEPTAIPSASPTPAATPSSLADTATNSAGRRLTVPAHGRVEVRLPASPSNSGTATFQVAVATAGSSDAAMVSLPVHVPATTEAFATNGVLDGGAILQPVATPQDALPNYGGLEITTSSTQLQALTDALSYLQSYPFDCNEQLASKILSAAALRDVLKAFQVRGLQSAPEMAQAMDKALALLASRQHANGGFGYWAASEGPVDPYLSVHVTHALQRAREKGFKVPAVMLRNARHYLKRIDQDIPRRCGRTGRAAIKAYALYVRHRFHDRNLASIALALVEGSRPGKPKQENPIQEHSTGTSPGVPGHLTAETIGWLLPVLHANRKTRPVADRLYQHLLGQVTETAREAHFTDSYGEDDPWMLYSDHRADAVFLESLLTVDPASDLVPKLVQGLLSHQRQGRWMSTQENVFALLALDRYFHRFESRRPDFAARVWVGENLAGTHRFLGHSTRRQSLRIPMPALVGALAATAPFRDDKNAPNGGASPVGVTLEKSGTGRLYYRLALRYAPRTFAVGPTDHGFTVERKYEAVEKAQDVRRNEAGVWHVKAGALVRVRIRMKTRAQRHHVALVDPLPAGLEIVNPSLAGNQRVRDDDGGGSLEDYWKGVASSGWFEHQDLRDDRAQAFTRLLWEGDFEYSYIARATTPGTFVVPPPKAEEMYTPEVFGRGSSDRLVVE